MQSMQRLVQLFFEGSSKARFRISLTVILVVINANITYSEGPWSQREFRRIDLLVNINQFCCFLISSSKVATSSWEG